MDAACPHLNYVPCQGHHSLDEHVICKEMAEDLVVQQVFARPCIVMNPANRVSNPVWWVKDDNLPNCWLPATAKWQLIMPCAMLHDFKN